MMSISEQWWSYTWIRQCRPHSPWYHYKPWSSQCTCGCYGTGNPFLRRYLSSQINIIFVFIKSSFLLNVCISFTYQKHRQICRIVQILLAFHYRQLWIPDIGSAQMTEYSEFGDRKIYWSISLRCLIHHIHSNNHNCICVMKDIIHLTKALIARLFRSNSQP